MHHSRYINKMRQRARRRMLIKHRQVGGRALKETMLIVCEKGRTEANYFRAFRISSTQVYSFKHTAEELIIKTIDLKRRLNEEEEMEYDQVWCVLDMEGMSEKSFKQTQKLARKNDIQLAFNNIAFELWYSLHFYYHDLMVTRDVYKGFLSILLGRQYSKDDPNIYLQLLKYQEAAFENAKRLLNSNPSSSIFKQNPSTTVQELVLELNKFL